MRQTLFFIPDELAGFPLFGVGWLLALWLLGCGIGLIYQVKRNGWTAEIKGFLPFVALVAAALGFVLPLVKVDVPPSEAHLLLWPTESSQGLPIRGYGVFLLIATVCGVVLAAYRGRKVGLSPDAIFSLAFYMFVGGIVGARLFWIIQYWKQEVYDPNSIAVTIRRMANFVEGGLVVYGSLIGALLAAVWYLKRNKLPVLAVADLIAPSLVLGLAIGRIGCLMNGCCFGGTCEHPWAITFPKNSPPYYDQQRNGEFYGFRLAANKARQPVIASVQAGGAAAMVGVETGLVIESVFGSPTPTLADAQRALDRPPQGTIEFTAGGREFAYHVGALPGRTRPVHPTQIYSSINAVLLCLLTLAVFPYRRRDGEVFALLIAAYAVTRFLLEMIRTDESSFAGTGMTISQNVSVGMLIGVALLGAYLARRPRGTFWPKPAS